MDIHNLEQIKQEFSGFQQEFETGNKEKALEKLLELLDALEEADTSRRAAQIDKDGNVTLSSEIPAGKPAAEKSAEDGTGESQPLYMSLNHVMEYYIFAYYFQPATEVRCTDIPYGEYYRTYGQLALSMQKYNGAKKAYERAIAWTRARTPGEPFFRPQRRLCGVRPREPRRTRREPSAGPRRRGSGMGRGRRFPRP